MAAKILIVDDDPKIVQLLKTYLEKEGFIVLTASRGDEGLQAARNNKPNLLILDLMLPEINGLEVCRILRRESNTPIIMLTARDEEPDKLIGLEIGADDYITKPFSPREVVARVKTVLRRVSGDSLVNEQICFGDLGIDLIRHEVRKDKNIIDLTPTEFRLLEVMAGHPNRVFTRAQLIELVQGYTFEGYERTVDAHIKNLRRKIEDDPKNPVYLTTVYGVGYKIRGDSSA